MTTPRRFPRSDYSSFLARPALNYRNAFREEKVRGACIVFYANERFRVN